MEQFSQILETEMEEAFEVKNRKALRRFALLLSEKVVLKSTYEKEQGGLRGDIRLLYETMERRFLDVNHRFEEINQRFEGVNQRFEELDLRFEGINQRFEEINQRFEGIERRFEGINQRFEGLDRRFEEMESRFDRRFNTLITFLSVGLGLIMAILAYGTFFKG